jgi:hypothetical protein
MIFLDLPNINGKGTPEQQLAEIRSYIYKANEQMNTALSNLTIDKIWEQTASAVSSAGQSEDETPKILKQYQRIRDLIIKTADVVAQSDEKMEMAFNGSYLAKSQFGDYLENTKLTTEIGSKNIIELFDYSTELTTGVSNDLSNYKSDFENYIKRGLLDNTEGVPVYGIEVGLLSGSIDVDGQTIPISENFRTRITPDEMSFWEGDTKVAYLRDDAIYFPAAGIKGGSININNKFIVSSTGEMTATSGTFSGTLATSSLTAAWSSNSNSRMILTSSSLDFKKENVLTNELEKEFSISPQGVSFWRFDSENDVYGEIAKIMRDQYYSYGTYGVSIRLDDTYGDFFRLGTAGEPCFTFISPSHTLYDDPNIYPYKGLYIETKLHIVENNTVYSGLPDTTITIPGASVNGAINVSNKTIYIDIRNGIVTQITYSN